jgi:hypothetical protein
LVIAMQLLLLCGALLAGCNDNEIDFTNDGGADFAIVPEHVHVGATGTTCCMLTKGTDFAMYLLNPSPGTVDSQGHEHPATGELHLTNPYGVDYKLGSEVPAFAYGFSPDGKYAMFTQKSSTWKPTAPRYELDFASLSAPSFVRPVITKVVADGLPDQRLVGATNSGVGFFSASGSFFLAPVLEKGVRFSPDLHIIDVRSATDVLGLGYGSFYYWQSMTPDDTLVFTNSSDSPTPGTPSVQGLYLVNLGAAASGAASPQLLDKSVAYVQMGADGTSAYYQKVDGSLFLVDLAEKLQTPVASGVVEFALGPSRTGPVVWVPADKSLHVAPKLAREILTLPAGSCDIQSPLVFTNDGGRLYYFSKVELESAQGDLYTVALPPAGDGKPVLVGARFSIRDFNFVLDRALFMRNLDGAGITGDLVSMNLDGSDQKVLASGVPVGSLQSAFPQPPTASNGAPNPGPLDLGPDLPPPVLANLMNAVEDADPSKNNSPARTLAGDARITGPLAFGVDARSNELILDPLIKQGAFSFSDDGYVLGYAGGATWDDNAGDYVGTLRLFDTRNDVGIVVPATPVLDGVAQIGPIRDRAFFVSAPSNTTSAGIWFVKY